MSATGQELRDRAQAARWLAAGLCLPRIVPASDEELRRVATWLLATTAETPALPPAAVVADLGHLLEGRPLELLGSGPPLVARLSKALRRYEDHLLGRLAQDQRLTAAADAVARLGPRHRPAAVGLVVGALLDRLGYEAGVAISQGVVRALRRRRGPEVRAEGLAALTNLDPVVESIAAGYEALADAAEEAPALLGDADLFTLENLEVLGSLSQRMAIGQAIEAASWLGDALPAVLRPSRSDSGPVPTDLEDESTYPTGGFAAISTSGSLENLVTSELMYMERGRDSLEPVDLFDLRYAESELLYYTRDESFLVRPRRQVVFALDESLESARLKDPELRWQRLVLLLGLVVTVARQLSTRLGEEELSLEVVILTARPTGAGGRLAPERQLCDLLLGQWRDRGRRLGDDLDLGRARRPPERRRSTGRDPAGALRHGGPQPAVGGAVARSQGLGRRPRSGRGPATLALPGPSPLHRRELAVRQRRLGPARQGADRAAPLSPPAPDSLKRSRYNDEDKQAAARLHHAQTNRVRSAPRHHRPDRDELFPLRRRPSRRLLYDRGTVRLRPRVLARGTLRVHAGELPGLLQRRRRALRQRSGRHRLWPRWRALPRLPRR